MIIGQDTNHMPCGVDRFRIYFEQYCRTLVNSNAGENRMELAFREMAKLTGESINIIYSIADGNMRPTNSVLRQMALLTTEKIGYTNYARRLFPVPFVSSRSY